MKKLIKEMDSIKKLIGNTRISISTLENINFPEIKAENGRVVICADKLNGNIGIKIVDTEYNVIYVNEILKKKYKQLDDPVGKKCYELNNCKGPCIATCPIYQALNSPSAFFGEVIDCNLEKVNVLAISLVTEGPIDVVGAIKFVDCGTKTEQVTK